VRERTVTLASRRLRKNVPSSPSITVTVCQRTAPLVVRSYSPGPNVNDK
jgi:hypothetical protein